MLQAEFETAFVPVAGRVSPSGITGQVVNSVNETSSYVVGSMHQGMQYVRQYMVNTLSRGAVRRVVVDDDVNIELWWDVSADLIEELSELDRAVAGKALADDVAVHGEHT